MQNVLPAHRLTDAERATEAAQILARGIVRWRRDRLHNAGAEWPESGSEGPKESDFPLDLLPRKSVHADRYHQPENGA